MPTWEFIYADSAYDLKEYLTVTGIENDYFNESEKSNMLDEFDDVRLPRGRVGHHETGIPVRYWVAVEDYSEKLTNHGWYLNQSLQRNPVGHNNSPSFTTTDLNKAKELAKRAVTKCQGKLYVMIGKDDHSRGMVTQKNHLRGGAIVDCWLPKMHMWRDGIVE